MLRLFLPVVSSNGNTKVGLIYTTLTYQKRPNSDPVSKWCTAPDKKPHAGSTHVFKLLFLFVISPDSLIILDICKLFCFPNYRPRTSRESDFDRHCGGGSVLCSSGVILGRRGKSTRKDNIWTALASWVTSLSHPDTEQTGKELSANANTFRRPNWPFYSYIAYITSSMFDPCPLVPRMSNIS